ncbi:MAG: nucleotidyl transferase AbiEii/AbiGii toxin family protein [Verrucomicrobia subdivision 3 bacterium]|nr:nucleotidyl transferase AbiEii/AbiGii toxin family protein [Limisphaerales bacterium]
MSISLTPRLDVLPTPQRRLWPALQAVRAGQPDRTDDGVLAVASPLDLGATKLAVIQVRAEKRDYADLACLLRSGLRLNVMLGAARALYREQFNPMISLKALSYFQDGDLPELPSDVKNFLAQQAGEVKSIPDLTRASERIAP